MAEEMDEPYRTLLLLLGDCTEVGPSDRLLWRQQGEGATYRNIAALAYWANMSKDERIQLYKISRRVPLAQRHVGHLLSRL